MTNNSTLDRIAPLSGLLAVIGLAAASALVGIYEYLPSPEQLVEVFGSNPGGLMASGYIGGLSAFFLIWFTGSLYRLLESEAPGSRWLGHVAFAGGLASGVILAIGFFTLLASGARATAPGGLSRLEAVTLYDFYSTLLGVAFGMTMAVFVSGTVAVSRRAQLLPRWFDVLSLVLVIGLLSPLSYLFLAGALAWLVVMSVWLYRRSSGANHEDTKATKDPR